ncbi:hypothetical protein TanjilG_12023 [Lupinus angustifolius]|uniref:Uncharacterized protein n=1 Tax=Lupinus angustifolius TaxID=3871 RepID=A0A1J7GEK4_LUPAN|nr:hypothetical protein TanjilG_12023 [Lupinus angustifolius]
MPLQYGLSKFDTLFSLLKLIYEELLDRDKEKEEKEAKKHQRLADDFTNLLYTFKDITTSSQWEDCKQLFDKTQEYRSTDDESYSREIFEEYITHLKEKTKEKEHKREEEKEEVHISLELNKVDYEVERKKSLQARYYFGIIFLIMNFVAWFFRDYGQRFIPWLHCEIARIGAGCFLGLFMSTLFYVASICGVVYMYTTYASRSSCSLNIFFITWTAILLAVMLVVSLHSKGFLIAIFAIVMAAFSTGIDSKCFQFSKDKVKDEDSIPYNYGFFHIVFSLGAMYFAMLFISWDLNNSARKWSIDVGWASTWVKIINEWFAATIYIWMLISPVVRQNKVMDSDGTMQQTPDSSMA